MRLIEATTCYQLTPALLAACCISLLPTNSEAATDGGLEEEEVWQPALLWLTRSDSPLNLHSSLNLGKHPQLPLMPDKSQDLQFPLQGRSLTQ